MYTARFINPLKQFGKLNVELILSDPDGVLPGMRQWMKFPDDVTGDTMLTAAENFIKRAVANAKDAVATAKQSPSPEIVLALMNIDAKHTVTIEAMDETKLVLADLQIDKEGVGTEVFVAGENVEPDAELKQ